MALTHYRAKRDFGVTPEPSGAAIHKKERSFVVHEHWARRLHYDLRLELNGVLKSWAVPKGPSVSPGDKRLAVEVEDHPLEYRTFEGVIPPGQYGAGRVEIWDRGEWEPMEEPNKSLQKGLLKFFLKGRRLNGLWTLVRMKKKAAEKQVNWLLIKDRDVADNSTDRTSEAPLIESAKSARKKKAEAASALETQGEAAKPPWNVSPQLAVKADSVPQGEEWLYEIKYDGYRIMAYRNGKKISLLSRNGNDWTGKFPRIAEAISSLPIDSAVFDGEICSVGKNGLTSFQDLQNALSSGTTGKAPIIYFMFDMLYKNGYDLRKLPLKKRKDILRHSLQNSPGTLRYVDQIEAENAHNAEIGPVCLQIACSMGLEGIIAKNGQAPYESSRSPLWQKIKCSHRQELIICGFTKPEGSRFGFGALLLGYHDAATHVVKYAGKTGTGFTDAALREIHDALLSRIIKKSPFSRATGEHNVTWVRPELVCEVQFAQWTDDNRLRHASFRGLRKDKEAEDIVKEESIQEGPKKPRAGNSVVAGIEITHSSKIMEPASRLTKLDLAAYMEALSSELLRFAADRPLSLVRCPEGVGGPGSCFFQKHTTAGMPPAIKSIPGEKEDLVSISSKEGLIELAQFDVIEIHSWGSRITAPELADYIVLDLDPQPEVRWKAIARSALVVRDLLAEFGLTSFVKTTGGRGLHVVVPILPENNWETVRNVAHAMSLELQKRDPQNFTSMFSKSARKGNVFVDYLRNIRGATAIVPYSPRTRQHATVAMPLDWNDLDAVSPLDFTVRSAPDVVKKRTHDPWERFESSRKALPLKVKN